MTYSYGEWTLYKKEITTFNHKKYPFYFFSKNTPKSGKPSDMPDGYIMKINKRSKMPYLKFSGGKDSTWQKRKRKEYTK